MAQQLSEQGSPVDQIRDALRRHYAGRKLTIATDANEIVVCWRGSRRDHLCGRGWRSPR